MKKLFALADQYLRESNWRDLALIKFCLCAMGILLGLAVAPRHKRKVGLAAAGVFAATYIPLMAKLAKIAFRKEKNAIVLPAEEQA